MLSQLILDTLGISTHSARTWPTWRSADEAFAYAFVEVDDEPTGNLLLELITQLRIDGTALAAEWCTDSIAAIRVAAMCVTNPNHPHHSLYYHHRHGLVRLYSHVTNADIHQLSWPLLHLSPSLTTSFDC